MPKRKDKRHLDPERWKKAFKRRRDPETGGSRIYVSDEKRKMIKDLASLQMPLRSISAITGLSPQTLIRRFGKEIREGRETAKAAIATVLFNMATQQKDKKVAMYLGDRLLYRRDRDSMEEDEIDTSTETDAQKSAALKPEEYVLNWADESVPPKEPDVEDPEAEE